MLSRNSGWLEVKGDRDKTADRETRGMVKRAAEAATAAGNGEDNPQRRPTSSNDLALCAAENSL